MTTGPTRGASWRVRWVDGLPWVAPLTVLFVVWLWYVFNSGAFQPRQWLSGALAVALFGLLAALLSAYPGQPRGTAVLIVSLFAAYAVWVGLSALWAESTSRVWLETTRVFFLVLLFTLALVYLREPAARRAFPLLLLIAVLALLVASIWRLWTAPDVDHLFIENRWAWPIDYPNNNAALYLIGFWPLVWLAATAAHGLLVRATALATATGVLGLFVMTQSRGALWALALSTAVMFLISPIRLRTFFYLLVPTVLTVLYQFPTLNRFWSEGVTEELRGAGFVALMTASVLGGICCALFVFAERRLPKKSSLKVACGGTILVILLAAGSWGAAGLTHHIGGPGAWMNQAWRQFTGQTSTLDASPGSEAPSRFSVVSSSGRVDIWRVAWESFLEKPLTGVGADGFIYRYDRFRQLESDSQHAHSLQLQLLGETGAIGALLAFLGMTAGLVALMRQRTYEGLRHVRQVFAAIHARLKNEGGQPRASDTSGSEGSSAVYAWQMAVVAALSYWMIHASVDWLWQMVGVAIPALLLFAAGLTTAQTPDCVGSASKVEGIQRQSANEAGRPVHLPSTTFRALLLLTSLIVLIMAGLPYLSLKVQESALALAHTDRARAASRAEAAHWSQPSDPQPYVTQSHIYSAGANVVGEVTAGDKAGAALDNLALSIDSLAKACELEPASWSLWYQKGVETLNLVLVRLEVSGALPSDWDYPQAMAQVPGLADWSSLGPSTPPELPLPGLSDYSLATSPSAVATAGQYRNESDEALAAMIAFDLRNAGQRNPLAPQIGAAIAAITSLSGSRAATGVQ